MSRTSFYPGEHSAHFLFLRSEHAYIPHAATRCRGRLDLLMFAKHLRAFSATPRVKRMPPLILSGRQSCESLMDRLVPKRGLEPPRPDGHYTLNVARLPIPPLRHAWY